MGLSRVALFFVWRDVKVRYKQTVIGFLWVVIQPLMTMGVFTIFFGRLAKLPSQGLPLSGLLFRRAGSLGLFFQRTHQLHQYRGDQPARHYQGLLSPAGAPVGGGVFAAHRLLRRTRRDDCAHIVLRDPSAGDGAFVAGADRPRGVDGPCGWAVDFRAQRAVSRRDVHYPVRRAVLDDRFSGRVPKFACAAAMASTLWTQPDGRRH